VSYTIETDFQTYKETSKDDVIARLMALYSQATENSLKVTWPDGSSIEYEAVE